ncbi:MULTISPECIES: hypothetical protein [unclassified Pseudoclavibacter]|uniref:hypothetical protein n=1 Tax=unclassified Pseudoclavibacter TaxID=2615177 RepID=UPI001BACC9C3|nr:hypothetical protein [Pseudoclavibacter sp. Marseille-Q4354]MBS3177213.1 hypothetical protein [Pseudoclavibacter sp. Marseille-Q4354]
MITDTQGNALAAAVDVVLALLAAAERRSSFSSPGEAPSDLDAENERKKREAMARERARYRSLRKRIDADEKHGVPVALDALDLALGVRPTTWIDDNDDTEELYKLYVESL